MGIATAVLIFGFVIIIGGAFAFWIYIKNETKNTQRGIDEFSQHMHSKIQEHQKEIRHKTKMLKKNIKQYAKSKVKKLIQEAKQGKTNLNADKTRKNK